MFKVILTVRKRDGMSREAFIDYYDNVHVPFMHALLGGGGASVHRRNFVVPEPGGAGEIERGAGADETRIDAITEVLYKDRAAAEMAMQAFADADKRRQAQADEDRFIRPGSLRRYIVEVHETVFERVPES